MTQFKIKKLKDGSFDIITGGGGKTPTVNGRPIVYQDEISNPNLLINGDFRVNQRNQTRYTRTSVGSLYTVDRWNLYGSSDLIVDVNTDNSVTVTNTGSSTRYFGQKLEGIKEFLGKTLTLSCSYVKHSGNQSALWLEGGKLVGQDAQLNSSTQTIASVVYTVPTNASYIKYNFSIAPNSSITLYWCKMEFGSVSTAFNPKPYAEELALCQRYFLSINTPFAEAITGITYNAGNQASMKIWTPVSMRTMPTLQVSALPTLRFSGNNVAATSVTVSNISSNSIVLTYVAALSPNCVVASYGLNASLDAEIY